MRVDGHQSVPPAGGASPRRPVGNDAPETAAIDRPDGASRAVHDDIRPGTRALVEEVTRFMEQLPAHEVRTALIAEARDALSNGTLATAEVFLRAAEGMLKP